MHAALWTVVLLCGDPQIVVIAPEAQPAPAMVKLMPFEVHVPGMARYRYWKFRAGYFQGNFDYRRALDYPWDMQSHPYGPPRFAPVHGVVPEGGMPPDGIRVIEEVETPRPAHRELTPQKIAPGMKDSS